MMRTTITFSVISLLLTLVKAPVPDPAQCDDKVTKCVQNYAKCSTDVLRKAADLGYFSFIFNSVPIPPNIKCAKGRIYDVSKDGKTAKAEVITEFKDKTPRVVDNYKQEVKGCWEIEETDKNGKKFKIITFPVEGCLCYTRCSKFKSAGERNVAGAVKVGTEKLAKTKACLQKCNDIIKKCNINAKQNPIPTCTS